MGKRFMGIERTILRPPPNRPGPIKMKFGACQNATTSADETIYELLVLVDKPELLSQAISVLAELRFEFQQKIWKKKEVYFGRISRNSQCQWSDARCTLEFDDGRIKGSVHRIHFLILWHVHC
ncbi:hypothetical protein MKW98_008948 [Papaver atlanticum]|uniref:Uncharacterized protein n=1 Tax=Papaver atlanticum TaxID=357466 RepID=A0AAD4XFQ8_9MAGN|nr:hypothetical protein MKW98_008948 [Papaver atlanticum]